MTSWGWVFAVVGVVGLVLGLWALVQGDLGIAAVLVLTLAVGVGGVLAEGALSKAGG